MAGEERVGSCDDADDDQPVERVVDEVDPMHLHNVQSMALSARLDQIVTILIGSIHVQLIELELPVDPLDSEVTVADILDQSIKVP